MCRGFQDREVYEGIEFPRPASAELLKTVRDWEADLSDVTEEQVKAQLGLETVVLPATSEPSLEEFFYDEDVEASLAAVEQREARRAERGGGGRFGAGGRGTRGGRFGDREERGRGRFGASSRGARGRGGRSGGASEFVSSDYNDRSRTGDGWDRTPRRQQQRDQFDGGDTTGSGGSDWYEGGSTRGTSTGFENDSRDDISGWFTGSTNTANAIGDDDVDDDIGWFGAEYTIPSQNTTSTRDMKTNIPRSNANVGDGDGGLLSDDDDEFWSPPAKDTKEKDPLQSGNATMNAPRLNDGSGDSTAGAAIDDLDAIWGAGMGGGEWIAMDAPTKDDTRYRENTNYRERGGRGGGRGGRFERGGGRGGGTFSQRSSSSREYNDSRDNRFSGGDDLSWWDAPGEARGTASTSAAAEKTTTESPSSSSSPSTTSSSSSSSLSSYAAPDEKSNTWNDGDDWFSDDADVSKSNKSVSGRGSGSGGDEAAASPLSAGTKVEVVSGRFQDFEGVIVESKGERVKAELDVFGTPTVVEISRGEVEPFES